MMPEQKHANQFLRSSIREALCLTYIKVPLSPRVGDLRDRTVYVIDSGIYGAYAFTNRESPGFLTP